MSFSGRVKTEISEKLENASHCRLAQLLAVISAAGSYEVSPSRVYLNIETENFYAARCAYILIKKLSHIAPELRVISGGYMGKNRLYIVTLRDIPASAKLMKELGLIKKSGALIDLELPLTEQIKLRECCKRAFIRGAFVAAGTISDPNKAYHLEITGASPEKAKEIKSILEEFDITSRIYTRSGKQVLYIKEGNAVADCLGLIGASRAVMDLENIRILRDISGTVNRQVNCEAANIKKTVSAGNAQLADIDIIDKNAGIRSLPEDLREVAMLRIDNPDLPIAEIGKLLKKPLGKSGIYHRFARIHDIAQTYKK